MIEMKKVLSILLVLSTLLLLSSCKNTEYEAEVSLPIKGHFSVKGDIIIETKEMYAANNVIPNAKAYTYKDGKFYKLKRYETEITILKKHTIYGENYGYDTPLKLQYYICNSTVYAYPIFDIEQQSDVGVQVISIPENENCVIIQGAYILPLYVNLKSGKITEICRKDNSGFDLASKVLSVSEDGKYAAVLGTAVGTFIPEAYITNLKNFKTTKISIPKYDESIYKLVDACPSVFAGNRLYVNYTLEKQDINSGEEKNTFFYDIKTKKSEKLATPLDNYATDYRYPYIKTKYEKETATLAINNLKNITEYGFSIYPSNSISAIPNKTGQYVVVSYFEGEDTENQQFFMADIKNHKDIDLTKADEKFDYLTYDGKPSSFDWISETELLITCVDGTDEYIQTVINVKDALK